MRQKITMLLMSLMFVFAAACSSSSDEGTASVTKDPDEGTTKEATLTAAAGGTLSTTNSTLTVPAGAVAADTKITVAVEPASGDAMTSIYNYGPDGTQFLKDVELKIKYDSTVPTGKKAALGVYDETAKKWNNVGGSSLSNGYVSGNIKHFTKYTIILMDDSAVATSSCADVAKTFSACGGDIVGTWKVKDVCFDTTTLFGDFTENCPSATLNLDVTWDATMVFDANNVTMKLNAQTMVYDVTIPSTCVPTAQCTTITFDEGVTCAVQGTDCVCAGTKTEPAQPDEVKKYTKSGNTLTFYAEDGTTVDSTNNYCVTGNTAVVEINETDKSSEDIKKFYITLEKQ